MFLENETWELCPVKSNFNIAQLHVSKNHITEAREGSTAAFIYSTLSVIAHPTTVKFAYGYETQGILLNELCVHVGGWVGGCAFVCHPACEHNSGKVHCTLFNTEEDKTAVVPCGVYVGGFYSP